MIDDDAIAFRSRDYVLKEVPSIAASPTASQSQNKYQCRSFLKISSVMAKLDSNFSQQSKHSTAASYSFDASDYFVRIFRLNPWNERIDRVPTSIFLKLICLSSDRLTRSYSRI